MAATAPPPMYWAQGQAGTPQPVMMAPQVAQAGAPQPGVMMAPQVAQAGAPQLGVMMAPQVAQGSVAFYPHANQQIIMVSVTMTYLYDSLIPKVSIPTVPVASRPHPGG